MSHPAPVLLFDGICNLCNGAVDFVLSRDRTGALRFASLQGEPGAALMRQHGLDPAALSTMVLVEGGRAYTRSDAALRVGRHLVQPWPVLCAVMQWFPRVLRDAAYDLVASHRYRILGRRESCRLPRPGEAERFLQG